MSEQAMIGVELEADSNQEAAPLSASAALAIREAELSADEEGERELELEDEAEWEGDWNWSALESALDAVNSALTTDDLVQLNKAVDVDRGDPAAVAAAWLAQKGLFQ